MKKYLVGLIVVFSFLFIVGVQQVEAKKCCCAMTVMQSTGDWGVSTSSTRVYNTDQESSCVDQCADELFQLGGDFLQYEIVTNNDATPSYCFEDRYLKGKMNDDRSVVNFDTYLGCAFLDGGRVKHFLEVFEPRDNGNLFEGILIETTSDFTSSKPTSLVAADKLLDEKISTYFTDDQIKVAEKYGGIFPVNRRSLPFIDSSNNIITNPSIVCEHLYQSYVSDKQNAAYKFAQYPAKDTIGIVLNGTDYAGGIMSITTGQTITLQAQSSFDGVNNLFYNWISSSTGVAKITSPNTQSAVTISGANSGTAILSVKTFYGGVSTVTINNCGTVCGERLPDDIATILNKCLEYAGSIADQQAICRAQITASTDKANALIACKTVANETNNDEAGCDAAGQPIPVTGGEEGTGNELYNSMVDQIKRFSSSGLVGTDKSVPLIIGSLLKYVFGIVGSVAFAIFIYGGLSYMFSGGDKKKLSAAKDTFLWAALGLVAIFLSYSILNFVISKL